MQHLHRPIVLPELVLPRPADQVEIGIPGRVTLITSATGFGKSTLLASWATHHGDAIAWFSPVMMMQPEEVVTTLVRAVKQATGEHVEEEQVIDTFDPVALANEVRERVERYGKPITLVMDGPEFLRGDVEPLQQALRLLVEHQPRNLGVVVVSRNFPILGAEIARLRGHLDLIDERLLRIPDEEVRAVLLAKGVRKDQAAELVEFIGGWPAAIRIALNVVDDSTSVSTLRRQVQELGTARFFANALIDRVTDSLREALIATSVLEQVSPGVARALGLSDDQVMSLRTAYEQGIPLARRSEDPAGGFIVHTLFRDELLDRLRREDPDAEQQLRNLAAQWFVSQSMYAEAIEQFLAFGDSGKALETLRENYTSLLERGYGVRIRTWFAQLRDDDSPRSERLRRQIYSAIIDGALAQAESLLASYEAEVALDDASLSAKVFLHINRAWVAQGRGDIDGIRTYASAALTVIDTSAGERDPRLGEYLDAANDYIAQAAIITEQPSESDPRIDAVINPHGRLPRPSLWLEVSHPALLAHLALYRGEWSRALAFGQRAMAATPDDLSGSVLFPWPALVAIAGALREMGESEDAVKIIDQHLDVIESLPILLYAIDLLAIRAHALADLGRITDGTETFVLARKMTDTYGRGWWPFDRLDLHEARYVLRHGDVARAGQIAERLHDSSSAQILRLRLEAPRAPRRAQQILGKLRRETPLEETSHRLFAALTEPANSMKQDEHLRHMLAIAQEHGTFRSIFDAGDAAVEMITSHVMRNPSRYGEILLGKYRAAEERSQKSPNGRVSLSAREHQILGLLVSDMTLQQIAKTLFVSQNTLKTHLRNLYRKMQVSDRRAAVEKGRQLLLVN